ncbi:MAG: class I SAM-dependent methyltransferase [Bacteroidetes bacterium]|nr:MAG: class I SAM-dependent methyltransferase [Bacteroidota bacterium]
MTPTLRHTVCPVCHSDKIQSRFSALDYTVTQTTFEIWDCQSCSASFTQDIPTEEEVGRYYQSSEYISHSNTRQGLIAKLYQAARAYTRRAKRNMIEGFRSGAKGNILDIGCGTGEFLSEMKDGGWKTLGLEPDPGARAQALSTHQLEVLPSAHLFQLQDARFDVITMWHVLEHVHQLHQYLDTIHQHLHADGSLWIAVPNHTSADAAHYGAAWAAWDVPRHLYHFSPLSMKQLLQRHGFRLEQVRPMHLDAFYVSLLSEKYMHKRPRWISAGVQGALSMLRAFGDKERCSSVLYIARPIQAAATSAN